MENSINSINNNQLIYLVNSKRSDTEILKNEMGSLIKLNDGVTGKVTKVLAVLPGNDMFKQVLVEYEIVTGEVTVSITPEAQKKTRKRKTTFK